MPEVTRLGHCLEPLQPEYNPLGQWFSVASVERIAGALEDIYHNPPTEEQRIDAAMSVTVEYNWQNVLSQWQTKVLNPQAALLQSPNGRVNEVAYAD